MKKLFLALFLILGLALPAQAANTYWTAPRVNSCETTYGVMPIGRSFCSLLYDFEDALLGGDGGTLATADPKAIWVYGEDGGPFA